MFDGEWLCLDGIEFECTIGVTERERLAPKKIVVNLRLDVDFSGVKTSDAIADTVDYRAVLRLVMIAGTKSSFQLIEALGGYLGRTLLEEFPKIRRVNVEVWKPGALSAARGVGVVVLATRNECETSGRGQR